MNTVYVVEWRFEGYWKPLYSHIELPFAEMWLENNRLLHHSEYRISEYTKIREEAN